jgi:protein-S-isoprenylcysteine O-methyltransferase Ste14
MAEDNQMVMARPSPAIFADVAGRSLLLVLMAFVGQGAWRRASSLEPAGSFHDLLTFCSEIGAFLFACLVCLLVVIRPPARSRALGWKAQAAALGAAYVLTIANCQPVAALSVGWEVLAACLLTIGNLAAVYCLAWLNTSFSVLPEARRLVREGPYRLVRHPLYLAEAVATAGLILLHWSAAALAAGAVQFLLQFYRLLQEEKILTAAFPDYAAYAKVTPRLLPRLSSPR